MPSLGGLGLPVSTGLAAKTTEGRTKVANITNTKVETIVFIRTIIAVAIEISHSNFTERLNYFSFKVSSLAIPQAISP